MHDAGGDRTQTIAALPRIIRRLRARHYRLVTVPRLLRDDPPPRA
jgi:peptidoglycan/xylan/chitin deacetylase (PgdA/CDA1 family)